MHRRRRVTLGVVAAVLLAPAWPAPAQGSGTAEGSGRNLVVNGSFDAGTQGWGWSPTAPAFVAGGELCADVTGGPLNPWDATISQEGLPLTGGRTYTLAFTARADRPVTVLTKVMTVTAAPPYPNQLVQTSFVDRATRRYSYVFTADADSTAAAVSLQIGGQPEGWRFCLDDVSLRAGGQPATPPRSGPRIHVAQTGYPAGGAKHATLVSGRGAPLAWTLRSADGATVAAGSTVPRGTDATGRRVHDIDLSAVAVTGRGLTLVADGERSLPFDIGTEPYGRLRADALSLLGLQRSGTPIRADVAGPRYARPAGHAGVAPNTGDATVTCAQDCPAGDLSGGWYDGPDHGKYVVTGAAAVTALLSLHERGDLAPGVLDEARWELDFLLRMQLPPGTASAGMVAHMIHDENPVPVLNPPDRDPQRRIAYPPSTAATLALAATGAQCARVYTADPGFAARCLAAARAAWAAALAHPDVYASPWTGLGGSSYPDMTLADDFYWAATELYLTTGERPFLDAVTGSPEHTADVFTADGFSWQSVSALARLHLATVPSGLPAADLARVRASVVAGAERYLDAQQRDPYGSPYAPAAGYAFGSNGQVLNALVVLGTAFDLTRQRRFRDGLLGGFGYLLGRNPVNTSYVTGYGSRAARNQFSNVWIHQLDPRRPGAPPGTVAAGPTATLFDWMSGQRLAGCAGAACYLDDLQSVSTNVFRIDWQAAAAWAASLVATTWTPPVGTTRGASQ
ncbi:cellulase [Dactylosporangium fulvum]|uniref:Glycoside hydrolase family 9 protein n=1 Tax=Dactylosporangium fulvum TaxID=53359 RepID=A0ABY5W887_9ACTN|nr:glycoside hydrolase family 9 protein [Dactylosporangium fulvum]UWP86087.1 glycoside hydrolase family 9 protein [Dactylosporangium fulvum]